MKMPKFKNFDFEYFTKKLTGPVLCVISLVFLPFIFLIPSYDILTLIAKTNVLQQLNVNVNGNWLTIEVLVCCFAVFLCWSIVEIHRQRCNKLFEHLMILANEVDLTSSEHARDDALLKESIKLLENAVEDYAMLLLMLQKSPPNYTVQDSEVSKELAGTPKELMVEQPCIMLSELDNK